MRVIALVFVISLSPSAINSIWSVVGGSILVISLFAGLIWIVNHMEQTFKVLVRWLSLLPRMDQERARKLLSELQNTLESAGSTRSLLISLSYTMMIMFCMVIFHYFAWAAFPLDLTWRQMLTLSMASLVLVPPTAPFMIGVYQGVLVGTLALFRILDVNTLTAYAILVQGLQIVFWVVVGFWVLSRTKTRLRDLIPRPDNFAND